MVTEGAITEFSWALDQWKDWAEKKAKEEGAEGGLHTMEMYYKGCLNIINSVTFLFNNLFVFTKEEQDRKDMEFAAEDLRREVEDAAC